PMVTRLVTMLHRPHVGVRRTEARNTPRKAFARAPCELLRRFVQSRYDAVRWGSDSAGRRLNQSGHEGAAGGGRHCLRASHRPLRPKMTFISDNETTVDAPRNTKGVVG